MNWLVIEFIKKFQQDATVYQNFITPYLYEAQHVSSDTLPTLRSLKLHRQLLIFRKWKVVGRVVGGRCQAHCAWQRPPPTTFHVWKIRGCQCSFRLLMMGGVSPETCWASYKYGIIKFWYIVTYCWNFFMNCTTMHGSTNIKLWQNLKTDFCWHSNGHPYSTRVGDLLLQMSINFSRKFLQHSHLLPIHSHITRHFYATTAKHNAITGKPMCWKIYGWAGCVGLSWCVQNGISFVCTNLAYTSKLDPKRSSCFVLSPCPELPTIFVIT